MIYSMVLMFSGSCMYGAASENIGEKLQSKEIIKKQLEKGFYANDLVVLKKIFDENPKIFIHSKRDNNTLLHLAVIKDRADILELLLSYEGVNVNKKNVWGSTPLASCSYIRKCTVCAYIGTTWSRFDYSK